VTVRMGNINLEKCPLCPKRFDILNIESKKKEKLLKRARLKARPQFFREKLVDVERFGLRVQGSSVYEMTKKKAAKTGARPKKAAKKRKKNSKKSKKQTNPAGVRREVSKMVESEAVEMAQAVIDEGKKGQLATMSYLFEFASIFPPEANGDQADPEEECLAKTLLRRLNIPDEPLKRDDDEETENSEQKSTAAAGNEGAGSGDAEKNSDVEGGEGKESGVA